MPPEQQGSAIPATPIAPALAVPAEGIQQIFDVLRSHEERLRVTEIAANWCKATLEQQQTRQALKSFKLVLDKRSTQEQAVAFAGRFFKAHGISIASIDTLQSFSNTQLLLTAASFTERIAATKCVAQVEPKFFGSVARTTCATPGQGGTMRDEAHTRGKLDRARRRCEDELGTVCHVTNFRVWKGNHCVYHMMVLVNSVPILRCTTILTCQCVKLPD